MVGKSDPRWSSGLDMVDGLEDGGLGKSWLTVVFATLLASRIFLCCFLFGLVCSGLFWVYTPRWFSVPCFIIRLLS